MENGKSRFSKLSPLNGKDTEYFALKMLDFFSAMKNKEYRELLGLVIRNQSLTPLSFGDFLSYCKTRLNVDGYQYMNSLWGLVTRLVDKGYLIFSGTSTGSPPLSNCYYFTKEFTNAQKEGLFVLCEALGEEYIHYIFEPYIVRIEGVNKNRKSGTGSGVLIKKNIILTCKHNVDDLKEIKYFLGEEELIAEEIFRHEYDDIAVILIKGIKNDKHYYPYFGYPFILNEIVSMGYPPISNASAAPMISQTGEINAITRNWKNSELLVISSIVRPGNSGGPVVSKYGYIAGIVIQSANSAEMYSSDKELIVESNSHPFYTAISSKVIYEFITAVLPDYRFIFEDYN